MLLNYFAARATAWLDMVSQPRMLAAIGFLCSLLVTDLAMRGWRMSWSRRAVEGVFATLSIFHVNFLLVPLVWLLSAKIQSLYTLLGIPSIPVEFWSSTPTWLLCILAVVAYDFANYWNHRLLHLPLLWPVHAIHHSDPDVTGLTAYRIHLFEGVVMWASYTVLLTWLGLPQDAIGIGAMFIALHNIYVHVNVDWGHGPFRMVLASPRFHRWHHADVVEAHGKNLANVFPVFDWMFGTYYMPGTCNERVGAEGVPENDVVRLLLWPFLEWTRMLTTGLSRLAGYAQRLITSPPAQLRASASTPSPGTNGNELTSSRTA